VNTIAKISIVVALAATVGGVVYLKGKEQAPAGRCTVQPPAAEAKSAVNTPPAGKATEPTPALPRLLELGADKCQACKAMKPILDELKKTYTGRLEVAFIDVWKDPDAAKKHRVRLIPTQIFFDAAGKEVFRHTGFYPKEDILKKFESLGIGLDAAAQDANTPANPDAGGK
jgi:thioredoxin 1